MEKKIAIVISVIAVVAIAALLLLSSSHNQDEEKPEVIVICDGVEFYPKTGLLESKEEIEFQTQDELKIFVEKKRVDHKCRQLTFTPGIYTLYLDGKEYTLVAKGKIDKDISWTSYYNGEMHESSLKYSIDVSELAKITEERNKYNHSGKTPLFTEMQQMVCVDDTVRSIESQLRSCFKSIGGSINDRQGYAGFIASFAQKGIAYPKIIGSEGYDYEVWGCTEYWAHTLQTLFFKKGDCEDSAAVVCSLLIAAGYKTAMVGAAGHVCAGVAIDGYIAPDIEEYKAFNPKATDFIEGNGKDVEGKSETVYYGIDTIEDITPVGFLKRSTVASLGSYTMWGITGFYPVA